ncbi:MAG: HEPN domain-containing protein [Leptospiraceae bacterium]|nr:HEPN domain-containing protein [Leptospiraceae bacterium]
MDDFLNKKLLTIILKSERYLRIAQGLANQGDYDVACSKAYYSIFYIFEGLLSTKGLEFSNHTTTIEAFNEYFINTGKFSSDLSEKINNLSGLIQILNHNLETKITHEMAYQDIYIAGSILEECKNYLRENGFI